MAARASCWDGAAPGEQRRHPLQGEDHQGYAEEHTEPERDVDDEQRDGRDHDGGERRGGEPGDPYDERGQLGVGGGDGQQLSVAHAGAVSARVQGAPGDLDPQACASCSTAA